MVLGRRHSLEACGVIPRPPVATLRSCASSSLVGRLDRYLGHLGQLGVHAVSMRWSRDGLGAIGPLFPSLLVLSQICFPSAAWNIIRIFWNAWKLQNCQSWLRGWPRWSVDVESIEVPIYLGTYLRWIRYLVYMYLPRYVVLKRGFLGGIHESFRHKLEVFRRQ